MNEQQTIFRQLRILFQELYKVDPTLARRPVKRREPVEDTIPDGAIP